MDALNAIAQPRLAQAQNASTNAQSLLQSAQAARDTWVAATGNAAPQAEFNSVQANKNALLALLQQMKIAGDTKRVASLNATIAAATTQLVTLGNQLQQYEGLNNAIAAAQSARNRAGLRCHHQGRPG